MFEPLILINNAGFNDDALLWAMTEDQWDRVIDVTLKGTYNLTKMVIPFMMERYAGCIINISSVVSQIGVISTTNYATAKAGLNGFTKSLTKELGIRYIRVNNLALGYFDTGIIKSIPKDILPKIIKTIPLKRLGKRHDLTSAIDFLIDCDYVTGQTININGGLI